MPPQRLSPRLQDKTTPLCPGKRSKIIDFSRFVETRRGRRRRRNVELEDPSGVSGEIFRVAEIQRFWGGGERERERGAVRHRFWGDASSRVATPRVTNDDALLQTRSSTLEPCHLSSSVCLRSSRFEKSYEDAGEVEAIDQRFSSSNRVLFFRRGGRTKFGEDGDWFRGRGSGLMIAFEEGGIILFSHRFSHRSANVQLSFSSGYATLSKRFSIVPFSNRGWDEISKFVRKKILLLPFLKNLSPRDKFVLREP